MRFLLQFFFIFCSWQARTYPTRIREIALPCIYTYYNAQWNSWFFHSNLLLYTLYCASCIYFIILFYNRKKESKKFSQGISAHTSYIRIIILINMREGKTPVKSRNVGSFEFLIIECIQCLFHIRTHVSSYSSSFILQREMFILYVPASRTV